ncbi:MAG TPA: YceI family protein [Burkholderiales bacterium]|nr:YceI family protein [Burkholderiales bacterium]
MKISPVARFRLLVASLALSAAGWAIAQTAMQPIPGDKIDIRFVSKQMNVPVEGKFRKAKATVAFDPAKPDTSKAQFEIDLASIDLGLPEAEIEVKRPAWFDTAKHPTATFVSNSVKSLGGGKYEVGGKLTIKGVTKDVSAPFTVTSKAGGVNEAAGAFTIKRLDYKIGEGTWSDTDTVANEVEIKFKLPLPKA